MIYINLTQLSPNVFKCSFEIVNPVRITINTWLVKHDKDVYIIDTGFEELAPKQIEAATSLGNPKSIFLTHGHSDHIMGAKTWLKHFDIPVYIHPNELRHLERDFPYAGKDFFKDGTIEKNLRILTSETLNHLPISFHLTPGHCLGHTIYYHQTDKVLIAGDLFITSSESLHPPIRKFSLNINENIDSGAILDKLHPEIISTTHGIDLLYTPFLYENYVLRYRD